MFQDVYDWAGDIRTVNITKDESHFLPHTHIERGMWHTHTELARNNFYHDVGMQEFAKHAAKLIGDVNYIHPFREGNGRAQLCYFQRFVEQAGFDIDLSKIQPESWIEASITSIRGIYEPFERIIGDLLQPRIQDRDLDMDR